jgi:hypothetical protein
MENANERQAKGISGQILVGQHRSQFKKFMAMILGDGHLIVAKRVYDGGNGDRLINNRNHLSTLMGALGSILVGMIIAIRFPDSNIIFICMFLAGVGAILIAFLTVLKRWVFFKEIEDYFTSRVKVDERYEKKSQNEQMQIIHEYLGMYFSTLTGRIMSIGVIPIIAGIIVIILADLSSDPSATILFQNTAYRFDIIFILLLLGGATEALAFFFGFLFPDATNKKINVGSPDSETPPITSPPIPTITRQDIEDVVVEKLNNVQVTATVRTN